MRKRKQITLTPEEEKKRKAFCIAFQNDFNRRHGLPEITEDDYDKL